MQALGGETLVRTRQLSLSKLVTADPGTADPGTTDPGTAELQLGMHATTLFERRSNEAGRVVVDRSTRSCEWCK